MTKKILLSILITLMAVAGKAQNCTLPSNLQQGLVGYWPFCGNANDESGNGNNGVVNGATLTEDRFGNAGSAYSFDGTDITIPIANTTFQGNFTISIWAQLNSFYSQCSGGCYPTFLQGENCYFDLGYINSTGYSNGQNGVGFSFSQGCAVGQWSGSVSRAIDPFAWSHITVISNDALIYFYINGQLVDLIEQPLINQSNTLGSFLKIGKGNWSYQYFIGSVDDVSIYDRALSPEEVMQLYGGTLQEVNCNSLSGSLNDGLVGYWPLCGNAQDVSGNENHGFAVGAIPAMDRFNNSQGALYFNNKLNYDKDWVKIPMNSGLVDSAFTISLWTKLNLSDATLYPLPAAYPAIIEGDQCFLTTTYDLYSANNGIFGYYQAGSCNASPTGPGWNAPVNPNEWVNATIVSTGDSTSLYINGNWAITVESDNQNVGIGEFLKLGRGHVSQDLSVFNGWIDDLAIYNRALTPAEITSLYTGEPVVQPACAQLDPALQEGLVGYWPFCGNANDESGNGNDGVVNGATLTEDRFGNAGSAYEFDGVDDNILVEDDSTLSLLDDLTIGCWINMQEDVAQLDVFTIASKHSVNNNQSGYILGLWSAEDYSGGFINFHQPPNFNTLTYSSIPEGVITLNNWRYVTVTYNDTSDELLYYIDGTPIDTIILSLNNSDNNFNLLFGASSIGGINPNTNYFSGHLDDIGIWNRALTAEEINMLYTMGNPALNAQDDSFEGVLNTILEGNVALNDVQTQEPYFVILDETNFGLLTFNADGTFTYIPNEGFVGQDFFQYALCDAGMCDTATVSINIAPCVSNTIELTSALESNNQEVLVNTPITTITYATTGATGATVSGLPAGLIGYWSSDVFTISGTPTAIGNFTYTISLTGGCTSGNNEATGSFSIIEPTPIYLHNFNDGPTVSPYTTSPTATPGEPMGIFNSNFVPESSTWTSSTGALSYVADLNGGSAIAYQTPASASSTLTLIFAVSCGYSLNIDAINFFQKRQTAISPTISSITINGITAYNGSVASTSGEFIGITSVANSIQELAGTISVVINLTASNESAGNRYFYLDDFMLFGSVVENNSAPTQPEEINGIANPCQSTAGLTYSISPVGNTTSYNWTVPSGWVITSGVGTNTITVISGGEGQNGVISVTAQNCNGVSPARTLAVMSSVAPAQPGAIAGITSLCPASSNQNYTIEPVSSATSYNWTVPSGWTITSGEGTASITVNTNTTGFNDSISVSAQNSCGTSTAQTLTLTLNDTCLYTATIFVYNDLNGNSIHDADEPGLTNWPVLGNTINSMLWTNGNGQVLLPLDAGAYQFTVLNTTDNWVSTTPTSVTVDVGSGSAFVSFGLQVIPGQAIVAAGPFVGFWDILHCTDGYVSGVYMENIGSQPVSGFLTLNCDPLFTPNDNSYFTTAPIETGPGYALWNFEDFLPGQFELLSVFVEGPGVEYLDQVFNFEYQLTLFDPQGNMIFSDNWTASPVVSCSYDPNDLTGFPEDLVAPNEEGYTIEHFIRPDHMVEFRVRFQNTGNLPAEDVDIYLPLDANMWELSTIYPLQRSADAQMICLHSEDLSTLEHPLPDWVTATDVLIFNFDDIYLPDSASDPLGSHGYVYFQMQAKHTLNEGDEINEQAFIYFDNNPPIITNETYHVIFDCASFTPMIGDHEICAGEPLVFDATQPYVDDYAWSINSLEGSNSTFVFNGIDAGDYVLHLNTSNVLCPQGEDHEVAVIVHDIPQLDMPGDDTVCAGETLTYDASGDGDITWSNGATNGSSFVADQSFIATATATGDGGCAVSEDWAVTVNPLPSAEVTIAGNMLTAVDGTAWQWSVNGVDDATTQSITAEVNGNYQVEVTNEFGCSSESEIIVIENILMHSWLTPALYPNPMTNAARLELPQGTFDIALHDITGACVRALPKQQGVVIIDREALASGVYQVRIAQGMQSVSVRLVVE